MSKKTRQILSILGRKNPTYSCVQKAEDMLHTKKNAREILSQIATEILMLKSISEQKIQNALNFIGEDDFDAKMCVKCFQVKEISEFHLTPKNKNLHCWCRDCRREYDKNYKQKIRQ